MRLLNMEHRDIHVVMDFSLYELTMLRDILSKAQINYNSEENPELAEASEFLTEKFYPFINKLIETAPRG